MVSQILQSLIASYSQLKKSAALGLGLATITVSPLLASPVPTIDFVNEPIAANSAKSVSQTKSSTLVNGTYLYGQSSTPEQVGQEYLVFSVKDGNVIGAVYMPRSEFSCFSGSVEGQQLNLSIVDPYDETIYSHTISLSPSPSSAIASRDGQGSLMQLEGYQPISNVGENDQRILSICQNNLPQ